MSSLRTMMRSTAHKASGGEVGRGEAAPPAGLVSRTAREPEASEQGRNQPEQLRIANGLTVSQVHVILICWNNRSRIKGSRGGTEKV